MNRVSKMYVREICAEGFFVCVFSLVTKKKKKKGGEVKNSAFSNERHFEI